MENFHSYIISIKSTFHKALVKNMTIFHIIAIILGMLNQQVKTGEPETEFQCLKVETIFVQLNGSTGSVVSPCYPNSYTRCDLREQHCYVRFPDLTEGQWFGLYNGDAYSSIFAGDRLRISNYTAWDQHFIEKEVTFTSLKDDQFIQNYGYSGVGPALYFTNSLIYTSQSDHKFRLLFKYAHYLQRQIITSTTDSKGYIVSHRDFDYGTSSASSYASSTVSSLFKITGINSTESLQIKFLFFKMKYRLFWRYDYLTIGGVQGFPGDARYFYGGNDYTNSDIELLKPVDSEITFQFRARSRWSAFDDDTAGFILEYEIVKDSCPPIVENAQVDLLSTPALSGSASYTIRCNERFRTIENSTVQIYTCGNQHTWLPCIEIECRQLPMTLRNIPYLNISLDSSGIQVINSTLTFSCNSTDHTLVGDSQAICSADGVWVVEKTPSCQLNSITTTSISTATRCENMADLKQDPNLIISTPSGHGEPTEGSVISFSCDMSKFSLVGDVQAVCTSEGEWSVRNAPQCRPLPTSTNSVTVSAAADSITGSKMTKKGNGIAIYAGIGAGIAVLILVIVAVVLIIKRRRKANSKQTRETAVSSVHEDSSTGPADVYSEVYQLQGECGDSGGSGAADCLSKRDGTGDEHAVYILAEDIDDMTHQRSDSSKVIYSLAGSHDNENYANSSAIQRRMDNNEPANFYADITAAKKRRKEPDGAEVEMLENELYGM